MGQLHDLEQRLSGPWFRDKLGDGHQGFRRELAYETELVLSDKDTPDGIFEGVTKYSQLLRAVRVSNTETVRT